MVKQIGNFPHRGLTAFDPTGLAPVVKEVERDDIALNVSLHRHKAGGRHLAYQERGMAVNAIVKYGSAVLREKATPVAEVDEAIRTLVGDMLASMYAKNGVGLAAEQIGRTEAVCVIDVPAEQACGVKMPLALINPRIEEAEGEQVGQEGCLSFPDVYINVRRAERVKATYLDPDGNAQAVEATGLLSRAIQHEIDHLNGVLLVDNMSPVQKVANAGKLKRMKRGVQRGD